MFEDYIAGYSSVPPPSPSDDYFGDYLTGQGAALPAPVRLETAEPPAARSQTGLSAEQVQAADYDLAITGGRIVLPESGVIQGNLYVKDGKISAIGIGEARPAARTVRANGKYVLPGIIDPHVHLGIFRPFAQDAEDETAAGLLGGITTAGLYVAAGDARIGSFEAIADQVQSLSHINILPHFVLSSPEQLAQVPQVADAYGIRSFKVYLHGVPGLIPSSDDAFVVQAMQALKSSGKPCMLCVHAENHALVTHATETVRAGQGGSATLDDWCRTHPPMAEEEALLRIAFFAKKLEQRVYAVHISSREGVEMLRSIRRDNPYIIAETTSPYLTVRAENARGWCVKMEPPVRSKAHQDALWQGLLEGVLSTIGTDNVPVSLEQKGMAGSVWDANSGYAALQTHLPSVLTEGVVCRGVDLRALVSMMTKAPAEAFGLYPRKGTLLPGSDADITIVDMDTYRTVDAARLRSTSGFSILQGVPLTGWPVMTIQGGKIAAADGEILSAPAGRLAVPEE